VRRLLARLPASRLPAGTGMAGKRYIKRRSARDFWHWPPWGRGSQVGGAIGVAATAIWSYDKIASDFATWRGVEWPGELLVPHLCGDARGIIGTDYTTKPGQNPGPWDKYASPNPFDDCWYPLSKFRPLYQEFRTLSDVELSSKLYADAGRPLRDPPNPWVALGIRTGFAFAVPSAVLILGAAFGWAVRGFRN
jgi:hypothetical protein